MSTMQSLSVTRSRDNRQSYLLRLWQPHVNSRWCIQLRSVDGVHEVMFESLETLVQFLEAGMGEEDGGNW